MSSRALYRLCGMALILGSILFATGYAISSILLPQGGIHIYTDPLAVPAYALRISGAMLLLMGMSGMIIRQAQAARSMKLSLIGFMMTFLGLAMLEVGMNSVFAFIFPPLAARPDARALLISLDANRPIVISIAFALGLVLEIFGSLMLGIAILRAKVLPRLSGMMLVAIPLLIIIALPDILMVQAITGVAFAVMFGLAFASCGYSFLTATKTSGRAEPAMNGHAAMSEQQLNAEELTALRG
ncbi:MAG TPA: hypothetical protein VFB60_17900 [Ktedonobacteraceae bacterium]|nr:hypothetical protein [Ktedonobacteraceae bacterium]